MQANDRTTNDGPPAGNNSSTSARGRPLHIMCLQYVLPSILVPTIYQLQRAARCRQHGLHKELRTIVVRASMAQLPRRKECYNLYWNGILCLQYVLPSILVPTIYQLQRAARCRQHGLHKELRTIVVRASMAQLPRRKECYNLYWNGILHITDLTEAFSFVT